MIDEEATRRIELDVSGMSCASCARRIESALAAAPGVVEATVNFAVRRAVVRVRDPGPSAEELAAAVARAGYGAAVRRDGARDRREVGRSAEQAADAEDAEGAAARRAAIVAAVLAAPLIAVAMSHGAWTALAGAPETLLQATLATAILFGPGRRILSAALAAVRRRAADMNVLLAVGATAAWAHASVAAAAFAVRGAPPDDPPHLYFEAAGAVIAFALAGRALEARARRRLSEAVRRLAAAAPAVARRRDADGAELEVPAAEIVAGDVVVVRPGERFPADGDVLDGVSEADESALTGESAPRAKAPGSSVLGGTVNGDGALVVRATRGGDDTALARIVAAVERAQGSRSPAARLADRVSARFVPFVVATAAATFAAWFAIEPTTAGLATALERCVAVLVVACPCALGLATPAAVAVGAARGAERGVLVKDGATLEALARVDIALLDKTGTLTAGRPTVIDVEPLGEFSTMAVLLAAASPASRSTHPVARATLAAAEARGLRPAEPRDVRSTPGAGVAARVDGREVRLGSRAWLAAAGVRSAAADAAAEAIAARGRTPVYVAVDGEAAGVLGVADEPRPEAAAALVELRRLGVAALVATGDRREPAQVLAARLGIARVHAELTPEDKLRLVETERARGRATIMVGDGVNDAPALAAAHVGAVVGDAAHVAAAAADVYLLRGGVSGLPFAVGLARATMRVVRGNLWLAFGYNALAIPLAAGLLYPAFGLALTPAWASLAMALSSVSVLANALRLRGYGRAPEPVHV